MIENTPSSVDYCANPISPFLSLASKHRSVAKYVMIARVYNK